ncbi:PEP-CTERM sorting domain-containing protein [Gemmatimonas sp.]|uniref:PEP-CTERM sorting domain-containing protein n=1 Tax=Gemmatimonas sp. TaxID=1962908 RepID=UPI003F6FBF69
MRTSFSPSPHHLAITGLAALLSLAPQARAEGINGGASANTASVEGPVVSAGLAQTGFVAIDDYQVLDTKTNLIWLKDWNAAAGSSYDMGLCYTGNYTGGCMTQSNAINWAASLTTGGVAAGTWRLPTGDIYKAYGSEYSELWKNVGGKLGGLQAVFSNVKDVGIEYWSGSMGEWYVNGVPTPAGFYFVPSADFFGTFYPEAKFRAVAVRSANAVEVPEPATSALLAAGALVVLGLASKRRRNAR